MQLDDLILEVRAVSGVSSADGDATDTEVTRLINRALRFIARDFDWPWLEAVDATNTATVAGTSDYALPADHRKTKLITIDNGYNLRRVNDIEVAFHGGSGRGMPTAFAVYGNELVLMPTPDAAYTMKHVYYKTEPVLVDGTDEPVMPDWALDYLVVRSSRLLAVRMNEQEQVQRLRMEEAELRDALPGQVRQAAQFPRSTRRRDTFA